MKKYFMFVIFFSIISFCYSQDNTNAFVDECIGYISKPVPDGFRRGDRTTYLNSEGSIVLKVHNGIVIGSVLGSVFSRTDEALKWQSQFYDFFEENNWTYSELSEPGVEVYADKQNIALIIYPSKRDDNMIAAMIMFVDDPENLRLMD